MFEGLGAGLGYVGAWLGLLGRLLGIMRILVRTAHRLLSSSFLGLPYRILKYEP